MTVPARLLIGRAIATTLEAALASFDVAVERGREGAVAAGDCPLVLVFDVGDDIEAEFTGGAELRLARFQVEAVEAARDTDRAGDLADRVVLLQEVCRTALLADRTLGGATLGLFVDPGDEPRHTAAGDLRCATLGLRCAFA